MFKRGNPRALLKPRSGASSNQSARGTQSAADSDRERFIKAQRRFQTGRCRFPTSHVWEFSRQHKAGPYKEDKCRRLCFKNTLVVTLSDIRMRVSVLPVLALAALVRLCPGEQSARCAQVKCLASCLPLPMMKDMIKTLKITSMPWPVSILVR